MIPVETRPQRMTALQWNRPGDGTELGVTSYRHGAETRWGLNSVTGHFRATEGDWIVVDQAGHARVYSPGEFKHKFKIIEEATP